MKQREFQCPACGSSSVTIKFRRYFWRAPEFNEFECSCRRCDCWWYEPVKEEIESGPC